MGEPLFDITNLSSKAEQKNDDLGCSYTISGDVLSIIGDSVGRLKNTIPVLEEGMIVKYWTNRSWSVYDMLYYLSEYTGPAKLYMTAWTATEEPVRILSEMKASGKVTEIHCLMDYKINDRKPKVLQHFLSLINRHAYTKVHAKVFVLIGKERAVSIVGSANFTENIRQESGTLFCQQDAARWDAAVILNLIRKC